MPLPIENLSIFIADLNIHRIFVVSFCTVEMCLIAEKYSNEQRLHQRFWFNFRQTCVFNSQRKNIRIIIKAWLRFKRQIFNGNCIWRKPSEVCNRTVSPGSSNMYQYGIFVPRTSAFKINVMALINKYFAINNSIERQKKTTPALTWRLFQIPFTN